jgi:hypothetical protein
MKIDFQVNAETIVNRGKGGGHVRGDSGFCVASVFDKGVFPQ